MNHSKIQTAARLVIAGACLMAARPSPAAEFRLRADTTTLTMPDGRPVTMWGFADDSAGPGTGTVKVPGPQLNVAAGDSLTIHLVNHLPEPVSLVIPGQYGYVRSGVEAVEHDAAGPYASRVRSFVRETAAGGTATYTWTSVTPGTFLYHSGSHASIQVQMGLYGALTVKASGPLVYDGVPYRTEVTLLLSEIDPDVHDAVAGNRFGAGPSFLQNEITDPVGLLAQIGLAAGDPVADFVASQLTGDPASLVEELNAILSGTSIYDPFVLFPDYTILAPATLDLLMQSVAMNDPLSPVPYNAKMVRLNRLLLQDGLANAGVTLLPAVKAMTSTIRSYPQYFLVNGQPYTNGLPALNAGAASSPILLRFLNAGMDAHAPTLNNGGDLQLISEDGQQAPYVRRSPVVWLPALKTVDALWTPTAAGPYAVYDRRLGLVNGVLPGGGMLVNLAVGAPVASTAPAILIQPANQSVPEFSTATVRVVAGGTGPLIYAWRRNGVPIPGATSASYSLANVSLATDNGAVFSVVVSGPGGPPVTSANATLTVTAAPPALVTQPVSHDVPGTGANGSSFTVVATGTGPLTYQWEKAASVGGPYAPLANGGGISGATTATLTFASSINMGANHAGFYRVVVTGPGGSVTSDPAELRVGPRIIAQPASLVLATDPGTANFAVTATGSALTYQWWSNPPGPPGGFEPILDATNSTYSFTAHRSADNNTPFRVVVSNAVASVQSAAATLTFAAGAQSAPILGVQPISLSTNAGTEEVQFSVVAYGWPTVTNRWQRQQTDGSWIDLNNGGGFAGVTTPTLRVAVGARDVDVRDAGSYRVRVQNPLGTVFSDAAGLTVTQTFAGAPVTVIPLAGGTATPYPATTAPVPALTGAEIRDASVSLIFSHDMPWDVTAMLVSSGPLASARKTVFMSGLGPIPTEIVNLQNPELGVAHQYGVTNVALTFDDAAPAPVNTNYWLAAGTYQPSIHPGKLPVLDLPAPAPARPGPTLSYPTTFSALHQLTAANGAWRLFVNDDQDLVTLGFPVGLDGTMTWDLTLTAGPLGGPPPPPPAPSAPQTPTQLAPNEVQVATFTPTYTWSTVPGATRYTILTRFNANGIFAYSPWLTAAQVDPDNNGTAAYIQPTALMPGTYSWWVVAGNDAGNSHFPLAMVFATPNAGQASPTTPLSPSGAAGTTTPTYTFTTSPTAQAYSVRVTSVPAGLTTVLGPFTSAEVDPGNTGTGLIAQTPALAPGNYVWVLDTEIGGGPVWSDPLAFSVP